MDRLRKILGLVFDVRKGERGRTFGMALYFFLVIACFWFLKPLRSALTLEELGADAIAQLKVISAIVSGFVVVVYSMSLTRLSRSRLAYLIIGAFLWVIAGFGVVFYYQVKNHFVYYCFYIFLDLFVTVNVALFWTFLADIVNTGEAKRLYGIIGTGGVIGGLAGSLTNRTVVQLAGPALMVAMVWVAYAAILLILRWVNKELPDDHRNEHPIARPGLSKLHDALDGARVVFSSSYFLAICGILASYELISAVDDFTFHKAVELVVGGADRTVFFSNFFLVLNVITVLLQLFFASALIRHLGMVVALLVLPIFLTGFSALFLVFPAFHFMKLLFLADNSLNYSLNQTAREMLFVPVDRKAKYRALAFIDIFVQRSAKALGGVLLLLLPSVVAIGGDGIEQLRWNMLITLPAALVFVVLAVILGRKFKRISASGTTVGASGEEIPANLTDGGVGSV